MELTCQIGLGATVVIILLFYRWLMGNYDYWRKKGVPAAAGIIPGFGHVWPSFSLKKPLSILIKDIYQANVGKSMVGYYSLTTPSLLIRDADLIKTVLQTEFQNFRYNSMKAADTDSLFSRNPFFLNDQEWKDARSKFITIVTAKKLKAFSLVVRDVASKFVKYMNNELERDGFIDVEGKDMFEKLTIEVAANALLGIEEGSFDKDSPKILRKMMKSVFEPSVMQSMKMTIVLFLPFLDKIFKFNVVPASLSRRFTNIVSDLIKKRRNEGIEKTDVLQYLMEGAKEQNLPDFAIIADIFSFFIEIFATSSLTMSFFAHDLAQYPDVQDKLRREINTVVEKFGGEMSYEAIGEMKYLDQVLSESVRLNPVAGMLQKLCSAPTELIGGDGIRCKVQPEQQIVVSLYAIHRDPVYWRNPEEFLPERFDKESQECQQRHKYAYIPFGEGPRMCPGMRMGILQIKLFLATIVKNFVIEKSPKLQEPVTLDPTYFLSSIKGGAWIRLKHLP